MASPSSCTIVAAAAVGILAFAFVVVLMDWREKLRFQHVSDTSTFSHEQQRILTGILTTNSFKIAKERHDGDDTGKSDAENQQELYALQAKDRMKAVRSGKVQGTFSGFL